MRKSPSKPATPAPAPAPLPAPAPRVELLVRLTTLAQELAGAFRPATVVEMVARTLIELLKPDRLSVILLDAETNRLAVTYDTNPAPARTDDPLLQLALRRGPLAFPKDVKEEARRRGADLVEEPPGSWLGVPLVATGRAMGAVSLSRDRDRKSTRLNSSHRTISYAGFCLKKKKKKDRASYRNRNKTQSS